MVLVWMLPNLMSVSVETASVRMICVEGNLTSEYNMLSRCRIRVCSCSDPTGYTVIIGQPKSNLGPESPEGQSQPIPMPLPMPLPMPPPEPQSPVPASPAGEENPGETLPESK